MIEVKKVRGIGMVKNRYYFKKKNNVWFFLKKEILGLG